MVSYLVPSYRNRLKLYGRWRMRCVPPYVAHVIIITNLIFLLFIIFQKQMRRWAIIFREAHSTLLARPRFQSKRNKVKERRDRENTLYELMGDDSSERIRPSPYDEERANHRGGEKEDEWERSYRLWFGGGARLWAFGVSCEYEQCGADSESDLLGEEEVAYCEFAFKLERGVAFRARSTAMDTRPASHRIRPALM